MAVEREYKSTEEIIKILEERNLTIDSPADAMFFLRYVGHRRLKPYHNFFLKPDNTYADEVKITHVIELYWFDRRLRLLLLGPLEKIEISLRSQIVMKIGDYKSANGSSTFTLEDEDIYDFGARIPELSSEVSLRGLPENVQKAIYSRGQIFDSLKKDYVRSWRLRNRYIEFRKELEPSLAEKHNTTLSPKREKRNKVLTAEANEAFRRASPWEILQYASFGTLVNIYSKLRREIAYPIADSFGVTCKVLQGNLYGLRNLRNHCAHHEPIVNWPPNWSHITFPNRYTEIAGIVTEKEARLGQAVKISANENSLYGYCCFLHLLLSKVSNEQSRWYQRLKALVAEFDKLPMNYFGFPENWQQMEFWCSSHVGSLDEVGMLKRRSYLVVANSFGQKK